MRSTRLPVKSSLACKTLPFSSLSTQYLALSTLFLLLFLTACDDILPPPVTPTLIRTLTGPTIEPSATFFFHQPTDVAFDETDLGQSDLTAAAMPADSALPPLAVGTPQPGSEAQPVQITAQDGALLEGDLYQSGDVRLPGVLILANDRTAWGDFPAKLHDAGFTVLIVNLRADTLPLDFTVLIQSLSSGEADPSRLAVIAAADSAPTALLGCSADLLCDALALLSPPNLPPLVTAMSNFNPRPLLLAASQDDADSFAAIQALQAVAQGEVLFQPFTSEGRGTDMLRNRPDLGDLIIQWLKQKLAA